MKAPIQIRREDVAADIRTLAELMKVSITDAVSAAVRAELERKQAEAEKAKKARWEEANRILKEIHAMPRIGPLLTDADFYDEDGLPKSPWS
jgi:antitoxin VapB